MISFLKIVLSIVFLWMCYTVISTSLKSNLMAEWDHLAGIPWMTATLWDFYANVLCIFLWIGYKEKRMIMKITWLIFLICLGSIATTAYVLKELFKLNKGESLKDLLLRQNQ